MSEAYSPQLQSAVMSAFPTILQAHEAAKIPAIVHVAQAYDEDVAVKWVQQQLLAVNEFAGAKAKLTDFQLDELAIQIRLEYGYLNLFEFILFCARLRSGKYEDFYGSIDPMRILKSLDASVMTDAGKSTEPMRKKRKSPVSENMRKAKRIAFHLRNGI